MKLVIAILALSVIVGCGQSPNLVPVPPPVSPGAPIPGGPYNPPGMYNPPPPFNPYFRPPMPPQMPPQFQPFMPVYGYFCQQGCSPYWNNLWQNWTVYAQNSGCNQYDFNVFWNEYCPQQWSGTTMGGVYNQINVNYFDIYY
ncbi:MAG: hypothetical protein HYR96_04470 [Deltaproteobacteria bacterium]|nr:hypothetical protein [Deltaproteobacteria bacterium]MBI3295027.1 hypothetical protein [Deltaproteobacteria bacterium]